MKLKQTLTDLRMWFILFVFVMGIVATASGWVKIPGRVDKVETKQGEATEERRIVQKDLEQYIAVNEEYKKNQMEQKQLLMEWIKEAKDK